MTNRIIQGFIFLCMLFLLVACSTKPPRRDTPANAWKNSQGTNQHRPFPLYSDDDLEPSHHGGSSSNTFPRPAEIEPQVAFWSKVYSKWGRSQVAIHDKVHMDIIYDVFDLPGETADILTAGQKDYIQERFHDWKTRLAALEDKVSAGMALDEDERGLVQHIALKTGRRNAIQGASERLRYQRGLKERFRKGLEIGRRYDGQFRQIFRNAGLPEDLAYLPHVESSFQYNAHSSAGALGIWQFTSGAAKMFMNGDSSAGARLDPINSTRGAARYLAYAYEKLGSWPLAVTSYNHGIGGMQRARNAHGHDFMHIVKFYNGPQFGFASRNYYAEFLAARDIATNPERYFSEGDDNDHYTALSSAEVGRYDQHAAPIPEPQEVSVDSPPLEATAAVVAEPEPTPTVSIDQAEPLQADSAPAEPVYQAELSRAKHTPPEPIPEPIYQAEPVQAQSIEAEPAGVETAESADAEFIEAEEAEPRATYPPKASKAAVTAPKKTEKLALPTEPKKKPLALAAANPKKLALPKAPVDSKKAALTFSHIYPNKATKSVASTDPKKSAKLALTTDSKTVAKGAAAIDSKHLAKATSTIAKPFQPTATKLKQDAQQKPTPVREVGKKPVEKTRVAKR
ncbi:MAG: transglycosylase SLT domain-containing protein [Candidatus Methylumidiphilus sp.]